MVLHFTDLTKQTFKEMSYRETVKGIPTKRGRDDTLTKTQLATCFMIQNGSHRSYRQIRNYRSRSNHAGIYRPSEGVPRGLDEKGWVEVREKKQVSRRTGRGPSGYEKKKEGGGVRLRAKDELDTIAQKLGYESRLSDRLEEFMRGIMKDHPNA